MDNPAPSPASDPASTAARRPLWRCVLKWLGLGLAALVLLAVALVFFENWRAHRACARFVAEAAAAGDDLSPESVIPPPVPDEENFAAIPLFKPLFDYDVKKREGFLDEKAWRDPEGLLQLTNLVAPPEQWTGWYDHWWRRGEFVSLARLRDEYRADTNFPSHPSPRSTGADILQSLSKFNAEWTQLREAAARPHARFPHSYKVSELVEIKVLLLAQGIAPIASLRSLAYLAENVSEEARRDIIVGLRFRDALAIEPPLISHLVAQAISDELVQPVWEGLARHQWTEPDLIALDAALARTDLFTTGFRTLRADRNALLFPLYDLLIEQPGFVFSPGGDRIPQFAQPPKPTAIESWLGASLLVRSKASIGRLSQRLLLAADLEQRRVNPLEVQKLAAEVETQKNIAPRTPNNIGDADLIRSYCKCAMKFADSATTVDLTRVAIALERHRMRHGGFPETLEALDAAVLPTGGLPHDLLTGGPLRYRRTDNGRFALYAVGWNGTDDGGATAWANEVRTVPDRAQGDWVWPQPAE